MRKAREARVGVELVGLQCPSCRAWPLRETWMDYCPVCQQYVCREVCGKGKCTHPTKEPESRESA